MDTEYTYRETHAEQERIAVREGGVRADQAGAEYTLTILSLSQ